jgi:hypothetical protein
MTSPMYSSGVTDLDLHDRLEQHRLGLLRGVLKAIEPAILNAISVGVHLVEAAVVEHDLDARAGVAGEHAGSIASRAPCSTGG